MKIKAKVFKRRFVTIVNIYDNYGELWGVCITENGAVEQYKVDDLEIIDEEYLPKGE